MKTIKKGVLFDMIKQIPNFLITDICNINEWHTIEGIHSDYGVMEKWEGTENVRHLGDTWKTGYHRTTWFSTDFVIPEELTNKKLYLEINFGGEAIVRIDANEVEEIVSKILKFTKSKKILTPVVVVPMDIRHMIFVILAEFIQDLTVLAYEELVSEYNIKFIGKV